MSWLLGPVRHIGHARAEFKEESEGPTKVPRDELTLHLIPSGHDEAAHLGGRREVQASETLSHAPSLPDMCAVDRAPIARVERRTDAGLEISPGQEDARKLQS